MQQTVHLLQTDMLQPGTSGTIDDETNQALKILNYDFHHFVI